MDKNTAIEILNGASTAFIDGSSSSNTLYRPQFISNNFKEGHKVLSTIEYELSNCEEFAISVAFITMNGIVPLLQTLRELESNGKHGKILTTDYLTFSEPKALEKLSLYKNIEIKMYNTDGQTEGFHTKGYIFRSQEIYTIIVGSSNITQMALTKNKEWNTRIVSSENGEYADQVIDEFNLLWNSKNSKKYSDFIEDYKTKYEIVKKQKEAVLTLNPTPIDAYKLTPNDMQVEFVNSIREIRRAGKTRALLISATGTGKTYASAFSLRDYNPDRALFIVHRETIAKQAKESFEKVFGNTKTYGILSGMHKNYDEDFIFATMNMMAKEETWSHFKDDQFDTIIIDEVHRAGAESYQKIINHFKPKFWLGMTASPDRTDGYDIYSLFDHNIAYEIRLQQALENDLLCPFHYFGISELEVNGKAIDDNSDFRYLTSEQRVEHIIDQLTYFGYCGSRPKGLIFCSRKDEAKILSEEFNKRGFKTVFLSGDDSQEYRESCIDRLQSNSSERDDYIEYIFTIDIFNEGVDIPDINQIVMLRPTQSPIIFIQQLGRGLRKSKGKDYVIVLDFIGNYANNFMIPIALSGDRSYNKDTIRRYVREGARVIPGSSTIHFDEISKRRIYSSIDNARTNDIKLFRDLYTSLKFKLGRIPSILDFKNYGSIDVIKIFNKCGSYYNFLVKYDNEYDIRLTSAEENIIEYMSKKLVQYKRVHELALLNELINNNDVISNYPLLLKSQYSLTLSKIVESSVIDNLTNLFPKDDERKKYTDCILIQKDSFGNYKLSNQFSQLLRDTTFKNMVKELIEFGIDRYKDNYAEPYKDTSFQLYQKYTYEDVARLLGWKRNPNAQNIGGYFYDSPTKTLPVFINYQKEENAIAYEDRFINENKLIALSKHPRKIDSSDVKHMYKIGEDEKDNRIFLFVRKNKDDNEAKEFYFLGEIYAEGTPRAIRMKKTNDDAFEIDYRLDVTVRSDIYDYIVRD